MGLGRGALLWTNPDRPFVDSVLALTLSLRGVGQGVLRPVRRRGTPAAIPGA
jgi:hypothetical protein